MSDRAVAKQADLERTLKAMRKAGYPSARVIMEPGRLTIVAGPSENPPQTNTCDALFG
ncbi:hypothetical protein [Sphingomonas sp. SORGH_AS_0879]|uniref:hypothetical protein n=1 Tax=Sphingomonas sp. SORGH_AS_0879 TaxID=3041790 RepID=UPI00278740C4|nr:hypothetical protein [Sphingomonas sp. SORGH_AS_0879]MDQ1232125.1 hypothetical protein [Sphingomonas sp. SORGH_AS_0879]